MALWMRTPARRGSEEEVENIDEDEDEEKVVVLGDVGCAAMRTGAALRASAASAAATAGRMEGMSSGCGLGAGGWGVPAVTWSAAVGKGGAGLRSSHSGIGCAGLMQCVRACGLVSGGGGTVRVGCIRGAGGLGLGFQGCVRGVCAGNWAGWVRREASGSPQRVCVDSWIWGAVRGVRWEGLWRACVVVWPGEGSPCHRARGCTRWLACVSHRVGSGEEGAGAGVVWRGVGLGSCSLCWCMCPLAAARLRGHL